MNRNRDLVSLTKLYESNYTNQLTGNNEQEISIQLLQGRGWQLDDNPQGIAPDGSIPMTNGGEPVYVGVDGSIDNQPREAYLADNEEDEMVIAGDAQEAEDQNPLENYEDEEATAEDEDECAYIANRPQIKRESYHGRANRDWSMLSESYDAIRNK
jgi:hypothetical protein